MYHYWAEPLYGYYRSTDPWVIRRHAQLLSAAGIDTLIFDTTNAVTYPHVYRKICAVFSEMRRAGSRTPQIAFMVNTKAGATARAIYEDLYQPGAYRELWFLCAVSRSCSAIPRMPIPSCGRSSHYGERTGRSLRSIRKTPGTGRRPTPRCMAIRTTPPGRNR